jgi:hypothetical protein
MSENFLYDKLVTLNSVYNNTLFKKYDIIQPTEIKTELYQHQKNLIEGMRLYKEKMIRGFVSGNQVINGKIGIIGDSSGTGKTLSMLSYLGLEDKMCSKITCELANNSSKYFFSHELYDITNRQTANLIIVPNNLFSVWKNEISKHTTLKYVAIETKRMIRNDYLIKDILNSSFVLTTNTCYKHIQEYATKHSIYWNNIIIDEASSIYFNSSDPELHFHFLWLVTSNWMPLLFKHLSVSKNNLYCLKDRLDSLHCDLEEWLQDEKDTRYSGTLVSSSFLREYLPFFHPNRGSIVLRNSNEMIKDSIKLSSYSSELIQCRSNITLNSLISYMMTRNIEKITTDKTPQLLQSLGVEFKLIDDYINIQPPLKQSLIKHKVKDKECIICYEQAEYPTITNCCYSMYCGKCLLKNMLLTQKCPMCRESLGVNNICCLKSQPFPMNITTKSKIETCIDIFKNNINSKFIVYSAFDNIYYQMFEEINRLGLKAERIEHNLFSQLKVIKNYQDNNTNILFVSNTDLIKGNSFISTSHLIFFHEPPVYEMKRVLINSAHRIGRKTPLKVIELNSELQV